MKKKILAISGSIRNNSSNELILKAIARLYSKELDLEIYSPIAELPFFNPDLVKKEANIPDKVRNFYRLIADADGVIICTPEYVFSLPGVLKNALEWTVATTLFSYKPFAFIVASASGENAFESLDLIMKTLLQQPVPDNQKLLLKGGQAKINDAGGFVDKETLCSVKKVVDALIREMISGRDAGCDSQDTSIHIQR